MVARKQTEEKIESAAVELFADNGYKGTSTRKIARVAGVSELTIYRCYKTKEELFRQALLRRMPNQWLDSVEMDPKRPLEEQLEVLFQRLYDTLQERRDLIRIFYRGDSESEDVMGLAKQIPPKIWTPVEACLRTACPGIPSRFARQVAFQVFSSYFGLCLLSFTFGSDLMPFSMEEYHRSMAITYALRIRTESEP